MRLNFFLKPIYSVFGIGYIKIGSGTFCSLLPCLIILFFGGNLGLFARLFILIIILIFGFLSTSFKFEDNGVLYFIREPQTFKDKNVIIAGGGDSALDWTVELSKIAKKVTLIHRRNEFRGANDSVEKVQYLKDKNKIDLLTPAEVISLNGNEKLNSVVVRNNNSQIEIETDYFIPLFGLPPRLGSISEWGLEIEKNSILVNNSLDYQTNIPGVFATGDINTYPGKLNLILCGFHEAALMCQAAFKIMNPEKKFILKYTTVSGVEGFDGTMKKAEGSVVKSIK